MLVHVGEDSSIHFPVSLEQTGSCEPNIDKGFETRPMSFHRDLCPAIFKIDLKETKAL
jgi:hypothetical protein